MIVYDKIDTVVVDKKVFVDFDGLIQGLFVTIEQALDIAELTGDRNLTIQITGVIDVVKGLDEILTQVKKKNGLAMFR